MSDSCFWLLGDAAVTFPADTVAIVGVGLIGGSIGKALRQRSPNTRVIGVGRNRQRVEQALELGAVSEVADSLSQGVRDAKLIIVGSPVEVIPTLVGEIAQHCPADAVITDVGSTKQVVVSEIAEKVTLEHGVFVGSHPLAGREKTGVEHAAADLFVDRTVVVTPTDETPVVAREYLESFWSSLDAQVFVMTPEDHDAALASTSHLPHVVSSILAAVTPQETLPLVSSGWLDTTRVAAGDVEMWRQILAHNQPSVLRRLEEFEKVVTSFRLALQRHDEAAVTEILAQGKQRRDALAD